MTQRFQWEKKLKDTSLILSAERAWVLILNCSSQPLFHNHLLWLYEWLLELAAGLISSCADNLFPYYFFISYDAISLSFAKACYLPLIGQNPSFSNWAQRAMAFQRIFLWLWASKSSIWLTKCINLFWLHFFLYFLQHSNLFQCLVSLESKAAYHNYSYPCGKQLHIVLCLNQENIWSWFF